MIDLQANEYDVAPIRSGDSEFRQKEIPIVEEERPPMIEIDAYRKKYGIDT